MKPQEFIDFLKRKAEPILQENEEYQNLKSITETDWDLITALVVWYGILKDKGVELPPLELDNISNFTLERQCTKLIARSIPKEMLKILKPKLKKMVCKKFVIEVRQYSNTGKSEWKSLKSYLEFAQATILIQQLMNNPDLIKAFSGEGLEDILNEGEENVESPVGGEVQAKNS